MSRSEEGQRSAQRPVWIEGTRTVLEALRAGRRVVHEIWLPGQARSAAQRELIELAAQRSVRVQHVERAREVRARVGGLPESSFEDLWVATASPRWLVALDGVTDVGNLGSIARSAETAGVQGLVLELRRSPPLSTAALKVSSGALEYLPVARTPNLGRALELARSEGARVLVADVGGEPLWTLPPAALSGDLVWVLGSEDRGVRPGIRSRAQHRVGIPLQGRIESLGVAAAAALLLHYTAAVRGGRLSRDASAGECTFR